MTRGESMRVAALLKARYGNRVSIERAANFDISAIIRFADADSMMFSIETETSPLLTIALAWH